MLQLLSEIEDLLAALNRSGTDHTSPMKRSMRWLASDAPEYRDETDVLLAGTNEIMISLLKRNAGGGLTAGLLACARGHHFYLSAP